MGKPFRTDHKVICEFSQNVLFTYLMIVLWYLFVLGICLSGVGLFYHLVMACKHEMHDREENRTHSMSGGKHDICFTRDEHNLLHILMKRDYEKAFKIAHTVKKRRIAGKKSFLEYDYYQEKEEREKEAIKAYEHWRQAKRQQQKQLQQYEESRLMEEAESFVVRDRVLCEEAFRR